jgi:flagellin
MSVINQSVQATGARHLNPSQELLGRSLNRLSSSSKLEKPAENAATAGLARNLDPLSLRFGAASTGIQNGLSQIQTADRFLGSMAQGLTDLGELASLAQNASKTGAATVAYEREFRAAQDQLRSTIGGSASEIGGAGVDSPTGSFNGTALFGQTAAGGTTVPSTGEGNQPITIPDTNLRAGAMLKVIQQDSAGSFALGATDDEVAEVIAGAQEMIASHRATLGGTETRLNFAANLLKIESENHSAALAGIPDADAAHAATKLAKFDIAAHGTLAMTAQANHAPQSVLRLLQK